MPTVQPEAGDWLGAARALIGRQVHRERVERTVAAVRRSLPPGSGPADLAAELGHRKALLTGALALGTGALFPGLGLVAALGDATVILGLQVELVYEVAEAYGFDLNCPRRQAEALVVLAAGAGAGQGVGKGIQAAQTLAIAHLSPLATAALARWLGVCLAERLVLRAIPLAGAGLGAAATASFTLAVGAAANAFYRDDHQAFRVWQ